MKFNCKLLSGIGLFVVFLVFTGCLEHREEIIVEDDGTVEITAFIDGDLEDFQAGIALPDSSEWSIRKLSVDSSQSSVKLKMEAHREIPYGSPLPATFAAKGTDPDSLQLMFPGQIKMWDDGARTFYEFKRVYQARRYQRYHGNESMQIDPELENRVMENGIFNVTEEDRNKYVDQMRFQIGMQQMYQFEDVLNQLVIANTLKNHTKDKILEMVSEYFDSSLTNDKILQILQVNVDSMEPAYNRMIERIRGNFNAIYSSVTGDNNTGDRSRYRKAYDRILKESLINERLDGHTFTVIIKMPGSIVKTNGFTDFESPGEVLWEFKGTDLHDRQVVLHALSVMERN